MLHPWARILGGQRDSEALSTGGEQDHLCSKEGVEAADGVRRAPSEPIEPVWSTGVVVRPYTPEV